MGLPPEQDFRDSPVQLMMVRIAAVELFVSKSVSKMNLTRGCPPGPKMRCHRRDSREAHPAYALSRRSTDPVDPRVLCVQSRRLQSQLQPSPLPIAETPIRRRGYKRHSGPLSWVSWFNETRLHGHCGDVPPAEFEAAFYAAQQADQSLVGIQ